MFESILVLLDSKSSDSGFVEHAVGFAEATQSNVKLAHIMVEESNNSGNTCTDPIVWQLQKSEANSRLERIVQQFSLEELGITTTVLDTQPIEVLGQQSDLTDIDLIILTKPSGNIGDTLYTLMKTTRVPILYVPTSALSKPDYHKILVPLDGSQRAECTLPVIQFLCQAFTSNTMLAHVMQPPSGIYSQGMQTDEQDLITQLIESGQAKATRYLQEFASRIDAPTDVKVVVSSNVASSIHKIVEDEGIDLMVLCAHGESGEPNLPFGSVAHKLISYAPIPILVVQDLPEMLNQNYQVMAQRQTPKRKAM